MAAAAGMVLVNGDLTIVAEQPKLFSYFADMQANLAAACGVASEAINIKATTTEGMGFAGRGEGMAAHALVLLRKL